MKNVALVISSAQDTANAIERFLLDTQLFGHIVHCTTRQQVTTALQRSVDMIFCSDPGQTTDLSGLLSLLREQDEWRDIPLLLVSGSTSQKNRIEALEVGASDSLALDLSCREAAVQINWHLKNKRRIEQLQRSREALAHRATTDGLTGLFNRSYFDADLKQKLTLAHRTGRPLTLLLADLDHFKVINDTHGHPAGDKALQDFAELLKASARRSDIVCRYGGEEFALILPECDSEQAFQAAERVRRKVAEHDFGFPLTVSIGLATNGGKSQSTAEQLLEQADIALYDAKHQGRNCTRSFSSAPFRGITPCSPTSYRPPDPAYGLPQSLGRSIEVLRKTVLYSFT